MNQAKGQDLQNRSVEGKQNFLQNQTSGKIFFSKQQLIQLVQLNEQRTFSEEIDAIEVFAQNFSKDNNNIPNFNTNSQVKDKKTNASSMNIDYNRWLFVGLYTDQLQGLDCTDFAERKSVFGDNRREAVQTASFFELLCDALEDFMLRILLVCSIISIAIEVGTAHNDERSTAWIEGFAIFVAVFVCSFVSAGNDYQKQKQFAKLNSVADKQKIVTVIRKGEKQQLHRDFVMVGDIVILRNGMEIPADGIVIDAADLTTDESVMTGEPEPVHKDTISKAILRKKQFLADNTLNVGRHDIPSPILMSGTTILSGEGLFVVTVVGPESCQGKIEEKLRSQDDGATPLQEKLETIAGDIGKFGLYSAITIICVLLIRFTIERSVENHWDHSKHWMELVKFIILGVTVIVVAIPEGLPLAVTLSLAFSTRKMLNHNNLVRKLQACETMGGADNICSDKTGTLTQNKMTLTCLWNNSIIEINTNTQELKLDNFVPSVAQEAFLQIIALNNTAEVKEYIDEQGKKRLKEVGSPTEQAFLKFLIKCQISYQSWCDKYPIIEKIPFSSQRKMMSRIIDFKGEYRILVKGASEIVLQGCVSLLQFTTGQIVPIDQNIKENINKAIKDMANKALRTICLAYKNINKKTDFQTKDEKGVRQVEKSELTLVAICGIKDILREGVENAVKTCQTAGITVRMVTGDNLDTARAIAKDCGIVTEGSDQLVMLGEQFMNEIGGVICENCQTQKCDCPRYIKKENKEENDDDDKKKEDAKLDKLPAKQLGIDNNQIQINIDEKNGGKKVRIDTLGNMQRFKQIYPKLAVLARSRPEDKYALVVGLMKNKHVVAVTGDGTNDAPALKKADVGFAMGIAGTQVAKDAADIIITDDNFTSIVKAVMWGRNIYDSIRKFLQFQLTTNIVAVFITLAGAAAMKQELLRPIQMLWVNLIMDTLASLALATEPPTEILLKRHPHKRDDYIISPKMFKHVIFQSAYQLIILFTFAFGGEYFLPEYRDDFDLRADFKPEYKYNLDYYPDKLIIHSGRELTYDGSQHDYSQEADKITPSRHFTYIFNVFVMLQFFNFMNARKILDELNIFSNILSNWLFFFILIIILGLQIIFITFGCKAMKVYCYDGLTIEQWIICGIFGAGCLIWSFIIKFIKEDRLKIFPKYGQKQTNLMSRKPSVLQVMRTKNFERNLSFMGGIPNKRNFSHIQNDQGKTNQQAGPIE